MIEQQKESVKILREIEKELEKEQIFFVNEKQVLEEHKSFLKEYFIQKVSPALMTIMISEKETQDFSDNQAFLTVKLSFSSDKKTNNQFALIELPKELDRFIVLPQLGKNQYVMFLDDLIRYHFHLIFNFFVLTFKINHLYIFHVIYNRDLIFILLKTNYLTALLCYTAYFFWFPNLAPQPLRAHK